MISEQDILRFQEAQKCEGCLQWHKHCKAECCKIIEINVDPSELEKSGEYLTIKLGKMLSASDQWYYSLHDVKYTRGVLKFKKDRIHVFGRRVFYMHPCRLLNGNLCSGHPNNKPELCKVLTEDTAEDKNRGFFVTDNCLFKYKVKGGQEDGGKNTD